MTKRLMILLAILGLSLTALNGCTSAESKDEEEISTDDLSASSDDELLDGAAPADANSENFIADALPEGSLDGDSEPTLDAPPAEAPPPLADSAPPSDMPAEVAPPEAVADIQPPAEEPQRVEPTPEEAPAPKPVVSLQKIPDRPWKQSGQILNTVYFARPGDTVSGISQMIYGADKTAELKKANPRLKNRDPKPSEKVFYNSPLRPTDEEKMMTYYEDNGIPPETYVAKEGDTIQTVGRELLGYDNGWKEVWPVNSVESKGALEPGTELRYWRGGATAASPPPAPEPPATDVAQAPPPPPAEPDMAPPPPPPDMAMNDLPPPPPPPDMAMNDLPPPPPPPDMAPPPPPPPMAAAETKKSADAEGTMDEETMLALGVVAVAALGLGVLLVARRRKRQRELEGAFNETQVGT